MASEGPQYGRVRDLIRELRPGGWVRVLCGRRYVYANKGDLLRDLKALPAAAPVTYDVSQPANTGRYQKPRRMVDIDWLPHTNGG